MSRFTVSGVVLCVGVLLALPVQAGPPAQTKPDPVAITPATPPVPWTTRLALEVHNFKTAEPTRAKHLQELQPDHTNVANELVFTQPELREPAAAAVLLHRLLHASESRQVRRALVDALPLTGGAWQEGAAAMIALEGDPVIRRNLVMLMRHAGPPHGLEGLRLGFKDEDPSINIAAARAAGFSPSGLQLGPELYSASLSADPELRVAAIQAIGMLKLPQAPQVLQKALGDEDREVRLQALLAYEQLDPVGVLWLPELETLARDRKSHRIARKVSIMLRTRGKTKPPAKRPTPPPGPPPGTH